MALVAVLGVAWSKGNLIPKSASTSTAAAYSLEISDGQYVPASLTVIAGSKIKVTNVDLRGHSMTSNDGTSFDTGLLGKGQSAVITAPTLPGTYAFHCNPHPTIQGTLVVK